MKEYLLLYISTLCYTLSLCSKLPDYTPACHRNDPNINACALKSARRTIPNVINGDPKYNVPPLDPILIKEFIVQQGSSSVGLTMAAHDAYLRGMKDVDIRAVNIDFDNDKMTIDFYMPQIHIDCIYNVTGRVLLLPIDGYGNGTLDFNKVKAKYTFVWEIKKKKDGKEYSIPTKSTLTFDPESFHINLENLFHGNKLLGGNMNRFMNENWKDILKDVGPVLAEGMGQYIQQVLNNIFQLVPNNEVFIYDR